MVLRLATNVGSVYFRIRKKLLNCSRAIGIVSGAEYILRLTLRLNSL